ncbi:hypothetical protein JDV02_005712, partial [Purpureocillium takamizusanense]
MASTASNIIPNDPMLVQLLKVVRRTTEPMIHDGYGFDKTYADLLGDVIQTRNLLRTRLPPAALDSEGLVQKSRPYVIILANSGYEFIVGFFAIRAIGGACIPL